MILFGYYLTFYVRSGRHYPLLDIRILHRKSKQVLEGWLDICYIEIGFHFDYRCTKKTLDNNT